MSNSQISSQVLTAYTSVLEQAKLEAYFHGQGEEEDSHGEEDSDEESEDDGDENEEDDDDDDESMAGADSDERDDSGSSSSGVAASDEKGAFEQASTSDSSGWTDGELNVFFRSLSRRSRLRPDLIAEDMLDCKSTAQVVDMIRLFDKGVAEGLQLPSTRDAHTKAVKTFPAALEMSSQWLELEEELARLVRFEQEVRDAGTPDNIVGWDEQVLNVALFLRHHPACNPESNPPNVRVSTASGTETEPEHPTDTWSFSAQTACNAITGQGVSTPDKVLQTYVSFGYDHCVPYVPRRYPVNTSLLPWRLLYRCIELGLLTHITPTGKHAEVDHALLPIAVVDEGADALQVKSTASQRRFVRHPELLLVWSDSFPKANAASALLAEQRKRAARRLRNTFKVRELRVICGALMDNLDDKTEETERLEETSSTAPDKEAPMTNGKRKRPRGHASTARKRSAVERKREEDASGVRLPKKRSNVAARNVLHRFSRIGVEEHDIVRYCLDAISNDVSVLDLRALTRVVQSAELKERQQDMQAGGLDGDVGKPSQNVNARNLSARISLDTIEHFALRVRSFVEAVIAQIEGNVSHAMRATETPGGRSFLVCDEHVHKALQRVVGADIALLGQPAAEVLLCAQNDPDEIQNTIRSITSSDPPSHPSHALLQVQSRGQEAFVTKVQNHLQGIKTLARGPWTLHDAACYAGVRYDGLISATDALVVPDWNGVEEDEREECSADDTSDDDLNDADDSDADGHQDDAASIYEGSDDERVIHARRDVRRGKLPDRMKTFGARRQTKYRAELEKRLEARLNLKDEADAKVQETLLWNYIGIAQPPRTDDDENERSTSRDEDAANNQDDPSADEDLESDDGNVEDDNDVDDDDDGEAYDVKDPEG